MTETIFKHASKTAMTLIVFALVFTALLAYVFNITKAPIEKSEAEARMALFSQIVPPNLHDNDMLKDVITLAPDVYWVTPSQQLPTERALTMRQAQLF